MKVIKEIIQSPLNYTGGKYKLLPQILPHFPDDIDTFVDLFCGGGNVGVNISSERVFYNDLESRLSYMFGTFKNLSKDAIFDWIYQIIDNYGLSMVSRNGYDYYQCNSFDGLGSYNKDKFLRLRDDFNFKLSLDYYYYVVFFVLIVYAFNNQIRFNSKGEYNLPVGKRDFNKRMEAKLSAFIDRLHEQECKFTSKDFREYDTSFLSKRDFVYIDPPYLITCASYNENGGWGDEHEKDLLSFIDALNKRDIRFALSNVLRSKGRSNNILIEWLERNADAYKVIPLDFSYSNSNYHTKDRASASEEVLVINY